MIIIFVCYSGVPSEPQDAPAVIDSSAPLALQAPPSVSGLQQSLALAQRNVFELRLQLHQLRHLQVLRPAPSSLFRVVG